MDEPPVPQRGETRNLRPAEPGKPAREDYEDERHGPAEIFRVTAARNALGECKRTADRHGWVVAVRDLLENYSPAADSSRLLGETRNTPIDCLCL